MADSSIDLLSLNREILLNPASAGSDALVPLLELEQPGLEFLCPLARAIYLLETGRLQRINAKEALDSCYVIDDSFSGSCFEPSDDYAGIEEQVTHEIQREFSRKSIIIGFASYGDMMYHRSYWSDYLRVDSGSDWPIGILDEAERFVEEIFGILDSKIDPDPRAYPTDKGEFLGTLRYTMANVNGVSVEGPTYEDSKCESIWENLSDEFTQRYPARANCDREGQLCWLHYLNAEQAGLLGIAASTKDAIGENPDYPAWVPKAISEKDLEATWISPDDLQESYSRGVMSVAGSSEAWFLLGCGSDWYPGAELDEDEDPEDKAADSSIFNPMAGPLITAHLTRGDSTLPSEILNLKPYLIQLSQILEKQEG